MNKNLREISIEQADALAQLDVQLYYKTVTVVHKYDGNAWTVLPSQINQVREDKGMLPLRYMVEVE